MGLLDASIALRRKRLAAVWCLAVSRTSIVCPVESGTRYKSLSSAFTFIGLIDAIALGGRAQIRSMAFMQFRRIGLHPTPNTAGIQLDTLSGQQLADVLIGQRRRKRPVYTRTSLHPNL